MLISGLGVLGAIAGIYALAMTIATQAATLRGGRRISLKNEPSLYWANFAALCLLVIISAGLIYLGVVLP